MKKPFTIRRGQIENVLTLARVADLGSFRAAARELGVSVSAVSQIIRALEARAQIPLLNRTTRTVALTDAGKRFLERAQPAARELLSAFESARSERDGVVGLLRLNVPRTYGPRLIEPILAEFTTLHPNLAVEVFADDTRGNVFAAGFDAGVRLSEVLDKDMVAIRLTRAFKFSIVGAPTYLHRFGHPTRPEDLAHHRCIRYRKRPRDAIQPWVLERNGRADHIVVSGPLVVNDAELALTAALNAMGLAYLSYPMVEPHLHNGDLQSVLDNTCVRSKGAYLYYPHRRQVSPPLPKDGGASLVGEFKNIVIPKTCRNGVFAIARVYE
jgi:DNA-binding transcriptional LysR family regulator